jgi:hypothetical protein
MGVKPETSVAIGVDYTRGGDLVTSETTPLRFGQLGYFSPAAVVWRSARAGRGSGRMLLEARGLGVKRGRGVSLVAPALLEARAVC